EGSVVTFRDGYQSGTVFHSSIARGCENLGYQGALLHLPAEGVFPTAPAHNQYLHGSTSLLVFEVTDTRKDHGQIILVSFLNGVLIPDGTARLDDRSNACCRRGFHRIGHGEEGIGCQNRAASFLARLLQSDLGSPNPVHLTCSHA